jgi:hypothetical protein
MTPVPPAATTAAAAAVATTTHAVDMLALQILTANYYIDVRY